MYLAAQILFVSLVLFLFFSIYKALNFAYQKLNVDQKSAQNKSRNIVLLMMLWFGIMGVLAYVGFYKDFDIPPNFVPFGILPSFIFIVILLFSKSFSKILKVIPHAWLISIQSFRILMEIILWMCFLANVIPVQMTFEGLNFDVMAGILGLIFYYFCFKKKIWSSKMTILYNIIGIVLLTTIVVIAFLSAPFPFRYFMNDPANTFITDLPFIWLPSFVVPFAFAMHFFSLKKELKGWN